MSVCLATLATLVALPGAAQVVGPNVNMGGGAASFTPPATLVGDPFLQRQNEPSLAVSSRNPCHLLAGANDYRAVDLEDAAGEVGDAWLGIFKSFDCGATWTSTLMPGHKLDVSAEGVASPLKGLAAAADATVRAGTSGLFYYSGIAFNRGDGEVGKVFVARFIDNNNRDGGDAIQYLGAVQVDLGTSGQFLDKPWIVADVPRGEDTCTINGRTVPAGPVYLVYTSFVGGDNNVHSKILFSRSTDCGATWSNPAKLSERVARNQGTTIAIDPGTGHIHVAWREFTTPGSAGSQNAILVARSTDGGQSFTKAAAVTPGGYQLVPFDQASSPLTFRTNTYPTIAVVPAEAEGRGAGQPGRVYVAWAARGFAPPGPGQTQGDARIVLSSSVGGVNWTSPAPTDAYDGAGHQIMPALAVAGGKLAVAYYDLRDDASGGFEDLVFEYGQRALVDCMLSPGAETPLGFAAVLACVVAHPEGLSRRHTLDMRAAIADVQCLAAGGCGLPSTSVLGGSRRVSRYIEGRGIAGGLRQQLQYNRPNLPIFSKGRYPFIGDYIDIAGQSFVATEDGGWAWNTGLGANRPAPVFHVSWADNRNVGTPRNADWSQFTPPVSGPNSVQCVPGQVGIRNQDVYTAQIRPSLVVSSPQNSKRIAGLQRSFVVIAQNTTDREHAYALRAAAPAGVVASFEQFLGFGALDADGDALAPVTEIVVRIPRKSSASRTLFVGLDAPPGEGASAPDVLVPVEVRQLPDDETADGAFDMVWLNPDFENPDFENPDFENAELHNPDFENPDFENPDFENPDFENFTLSASSSIRNPDFENPDFENPDFENPDFENPDFENPDFENPDFENPDFENPDFENPDFENPDFENPDFENGAFQVSDTTWPVRNAGNTTSAYKANVYVENPPAGVRFQLAVRKVFTTPAALCTVDGKTSAPQAAQSVPLVNIVDPNVGADPFDRAFNDPSRDNATFSLAPGERGLVTLRAYCAEGSPDCTRDLMASLQGRVALGVVAQGANCVACTGPSCSLNDFVQGATECRVDDGPPKDVYDPIPPAIAVLNPTIASPETVVEAADGDNTGSEPVAFVVRATDNVGLAQVTCAATASAVILAGVSGDEYTFAGVFPVGTSGVTCTAFDVRADPAPNSASVDFLVSVRDVTPPSFDQSPDTEPGAPFVPANPAEATGPDGARVSYTNPTASDSNGGLVTVVCASGAGLRSGGVFPIGTTAISCVATDESGVSTPPTALFSITVLDSTPPIVTLVGATEVTIEAGSAYADAGATASDAVSGALVPMVSGGVDTLTPSRYTITYTATDAAGNMGAVARTVTVVDTTAPAIAPAPLVTVEATSAAGAVVVYATPSATDVVGGAAVSCAPASGSLFVLGATQVVCTATDGAGNTAASTGSVTVVDTIAPIVGQAADLTVEATSAAGAVVTYPTPAVSDAVGATIACVPASGSILPLGATTITCTARDEASNTTLRTFVATVRDSQAPMLTAAANPPVLLWSPNKMMTPVTVGGRVTDATLRGASYRVVDEYRKVQPSGVVTVAPDGTYSFVVLLEAYRNGNDGNGRLYTVTVTAADASGRTASATATVTVPHNQ